MTLRNNKLYYRFMINVLLLKAQTTDITGKLQNAFSLSKKYTTKKWTRKTKAILNTRLHKYSIEERSGCIAYIHFAAHLLLILFWSWNRICLQDLLYLTHVEVALCSPLTRSCTLQVCPPSFSSTTWRATAVSSRALFPTCLIAVS